MTHYNYPTPTLSPYADFEQYLPLLVSAVQEELDRVEVWDSGSVSVALGFMQELIAYLQEFPIVNKDKNGCDLDIWQYLGSVNIGVFTLQTADFMPFRMAVLTSTTINNYVNWSIVLPRGTYQYIFSYCKTANAGIHDITLTGSGGTPTVLIADNLDQYGLFTANFLYVTTFDVTVSKTYSLKILNTGAKNASSGGYQICGFHHVLRKIADI